MDRRKMVYVCSPYRGNSENNVVWANLHSRYVYEKGYLPIAPHTIFTQFLDDDNAEERRAGMNMGLQLLELCHELWVFGAKISKGMQEEIEFAKKRRINIRYISRDMEED
jgi:hypothetical protein